MFTPSKGYWERLFGAHKKLHNAVGFRTGPWWDRDASECWAADWPWDATSGFPRSPLGSTEAPQCKWEGNMCGVFHRMARGLLRVVRDVEVTIDHEPIQAAYATRYEYTADRLRSIGLFTVRTSLAAGRKLEDAARFDEFSVRSIQRAQQAIEVNSLSEAEHREVLIDHLDYGSTVVTAYYDLRARGGGASES